jgi:3-phenylpropionate/trans-cinnamate dioxygenase alpha subunit
MTVSAAELQKMIDWESGQISPEIFISEEIYQQELEMLFGRAWLFLAHDSMFPNPGDFYSTYMGGDPVIIARQKDGSVKAFLNVCRHRGMKVCRAEDGNTNAFMCTYHGWTYDGSGALVSVPNFEDAYYGELDMSKWGLVPVRVEGYKGLWFGTFDESAPSLVEYLGDMTYYMDSWLDHADGGIEVLPGVIKWTINGNWKMAAEQFAGDGYHAQITHMSSFSLLDPNYMEIFKLPGRQFVSRAGHGHSFVLSAKLSRNVDDPMSEYQYERQQRAIERLGEDRARIRGLGNYTVFPNFSGLGGLANMRIWHPKGPNKFEIWSYTIVEKNAPEEIKKLQQLSSIGTEGAAGMVEIDDGENWNLIGETLHNSFQARQHVWNYQMGIGHERLDDPTFPGRIGATYLGEGPQRGFYRRYLDFLSSSEWPRIPAEELASTPQA